MAGAGLGQEIRRVEWEHAEWGGALLCLPAVALALAIGLGTGHRGVALAMAGSAQSVGFGSFQRRLWFRGGSMVLATLGMSLSAAVGVLGANHPLAMLLLVPLWAFCYGMSGAISSPASWVGQQCCIFLIVSSAVQGSPQQAAMGGLGVLAGGTLQLLFVLLLWRAFPPAHSTLTDPKIHPPGWQVRAVLENLTPNSEIFRYAMQLAFTGLAAEAIALAAHFHNSYWIPMTALIIMKPDQLLTNARSIARLAGTLVGAGLATLLAGAMRPDGLWLSVLIVASIYFAYSLQNVNYALYAVPLTSYIAFILAVGRTPERATAEHRVVATAIAGALAMVVHALHVRAEQRRLMVSMSLSGKGA
jgi:hypothetical protein